MKILIRLPNWLGDVIMSTAFINAVKQSYPDALIDVIVKKELSGIAALIPGTNTVYPFSKQEYKGLRGAFRFGKILKPNKYDLFFNLPTSLSSTVLGWASGAVKRIGFNKEGSFLFFTNLYKKPVNVHRVDEYLSLLEQFSDKKITERSVKLHIEDPVPVNKKQVLVNFNSEASSRRMPIEKAHTLLNLLINSFPDTTFKFIGSPKESVFVEQIIDGVQNKHRIENLAGKTDLAGLSKLMASSAAILTTDSGPAHLANSVGTPTIVLFGAGNEHNTAPYNKHNLNVIRYGKLSCEPCVKNICPLYDIPKCMQLIDELTIIDTLSLYLPNA
jgi:lipopolysaccharide heptosyltransferase II